MSSLISRLAPKSSFNINPDDMEEVSYLLYLWSLRVIDNNRLYARVCEYVNNDPRTELEQGRALRDWLSAFRWNVFYNFDVARFKLLTLRLVIQQTTDPGYVRAACYIEKLPTDSAELYGYLLQDKNDWAAFKDKMRVLADAELRSQLILDWRRLIRECDEDFRQYKVNNAAEFLSKRKLRFIADANNLQTVDFAQDLKERAIGYYYYVRPWYSRLHATNYAKSSLHGRMNQLIDHWTDPSRTRSLDGRWRVLPIIDGYIDQFYSGNPNDFMHTELGANEWASSQLVAARSVTG